MYKTTVYLLSFLLLLSVGGVIHEHDHISYAFSNDGMTSLYDHNCSNHKNHPDLFHNHQCNSCSRISFSSTVAGDFCLIGGIAIVDDNILEQSFHFSTVDYLSKSEPRSPPYLSSSQI